VERPHAAARNTAGIQQQARDLIGRSNHAIRNPPARPPANPIHRGTSMVLDPFAGAGRVPASRIDGRAVAADSGVRPGSPPRRRVGPAPITQADLKRLKLLTERRKRAVDEHAAARADILARHLADADVEPGRLALDVSRHEGRYFSREQLNRLLGEEETEELKQQLIPKVQYNVVVIETE
jgi:hypothetical protein